jgi:hypothetical protein
MKHVKSTSIILLQIQPQTIEICSKCCCFFSTIPFIFRLACSIPVKVGGLVVAFIH